MKRILQSIALILLESLGAHAGVAQTRVVKSGDKFVLLRDGQPYFVQGAGGDRNLWNRLAACGGNSVRTWGDEKLGEELDAARANGLTLTAGIWLPQVRQGFDYTDAQALAALREHVRTTVRRYKDHPALLMWSLGNEMEDPQGGNLGVWRAVNDLATLVKQIDPDHPVMTVVAEIGGEKVANFQRLCPAVDILGINSYGGVQSLGNRYRQLGGVKPYLLTEFGPSGVWEISKDNIGASPEPASSEKADIYRRAYQRAVLDQPGLCLGSYAFYWGRKQEATATWFSLFLEDGTRLGSVDTLTQLWTGRTPSNRCPGITLKLQGGPLVEPGSLVRAKLEASDPEQDPLTVSWHLIRDSQNYGAGGDVEAEPPAVPEAILTGNEQGATVRLPKEAGLYRLFATVRDNHQGGAVANLPIRVHGPEAAAKGRRMPLPVVVYAGGGEPSVYAPSGWMGEAKAIRSDPNWSGNPHSGRTCLRCEFAASTGWGGVAWQDPANDWGELDGGYDLTGAKHLGFWARGERGGETVDFKFGLITRDKKYPDSAHGELEKVVLTPAWRHYEIAVGSQDFSCIKTGFAWSLASPGQPVVFYLDDIRWE